MLAVGQRLLRSTVHGVTRHVRHSAVSAGDAAKSKAGAGASGEASAEEMRLLLAVMACPVTKQPLRYDSVRQVCSNFLFPGSLAPISFLFVAGEVSRVCTPDL